MKHPCDKCLVQACCIKECDKYSNFVKYFNVLPVIIIIISFCINIFMIKSITNLPLHWYGISFIFLFVWIDSFIGCYSIFKRNNEKTTSGLYLFIGCFSPLVFISLIFEIMLFKIYSSCEKHKNRLKGR